MSLSVHYIALVAKQLEIEELKRLKSRAQLVGAVGHMIHVLQTERGSSSIYLASSGERFIHERQAHVAESELIEKTLRDRIEAELDKSSYANTKIISLMAWVILGLDAMPDLRKRIDELKLPGEELVAAYSRLIAGLISLIFEVADAAIDPDVSRILVALFNFIQGKELAGQERAVGALSFGSGLCSEHLQQKISHLTDAQERSLKVFLEFASVETRQRWHALQDEPYIADLNRMRLVLSSAKPAEALDTELSGPWFESTTARLTAMWAIQCLQVEELEGRCARLIEKAEAQLLDSKGLIEQLQENELTQAELVERFFDPEVPVEQALSFMPPIHDTRQQAQSVIGLLQSQSEHLANVEKELSSAKRALNERKVIEQAKGILMARYNLSEDEAYRRMRTTSMDQNRRLIEVAESVLSFVSIS